MKQLTYILIVLLFTQDAWSQKKAEDPNSASFLNAFLKIYVRNKENKSDNVVHAETGIITINSSLQGDYTTRQLYTGNTYTVETFTDPRIEDFKLLIWKKDASNNWQRYDSADESNHASLKVDGIGDREMVYIKPTETKEYAIQLLSKSSAANKTGRYGVILIAEKNGTTKTQTNNGGGGGGNAGNGGSTGGSSGGGTGNGGSGSGGNSGGGSRNTLAAGKKNYLSCDYYSVVFLKKDNNDRWQKDGDWTQTNESSLFLLNSGQTMFEHTTPEMKSSYFIQSRSNDGKTLTFEVKSDVGNSYSFDLDLANDRLDIFGKNSSGQYFIKRHHLRRVWSE